ncbi:MAG TPA: glycosyltransferase family 2 protein, partial [Stellaceae bacterium]|nr:glycosyltransferase family 2 protein [Stellaceae bacterium]
MAQEPLVSVVMPCLDAGRMLRRALTSVIRQTYARLEIVFVDNGSTDGSDRLAQEIGAASGREFRFVVCPERGVNRARALGFSLARGDYIQWMDADDEMNPDKVALQVAALERERAFDIAFCDWVTRRYDTGDPPLDIPRKLGPVHDQLLRILSGVWYPP